MKHQVELDFSQKISKGLELYWSKLLAQRIKEDGTFVISRNGEIITVKARDLKG